jgi:hypothetical protein
MAETRYRFLLKYPTKGRADLFKSTFSKYNELLSGKHDIQWVVTMNVDDRSMNNQPMREWLDAQKNVLYCFGESRCKVEAINANMENQAFDILVLISDDMIPDVAGYDDIIAQNMEKHFPDLSGCLHFNDGRVGESLNTLSIMGKGLYDRFGYIYHSDYRSLWCDNEYTDVTRTMNKTAWVDQIIIRHAWVDATGNDALHTRNEAYFESDKTTFIARRTKGFPKETIGNLPSTTRAQKVIDRRRRVRAR